MRKIRNRNKHKQKSPSQGSDAAPIAPAVALAGSDQDKQRLDHIWILFTILAAVTAGTGGILGKEHPILAAWVLILGAAISLAGWVWVGKQKTSSKLWAWKVPSLVLVVLMALASCWTYYIVLSSRPPYLLPLDNSKSSKGNAVFQMARIVISVKGTNQVSIINFRKRSILSLQRTSQGTLLSGEFVGANGEVMAVVERNRIITNASNYLELVIEKGSLVIRDKQNDFLTIKHPDSNTYILSGKIRLPNKRVITIDEAGVEYNGNIYNHLFLQNPPLPFIQIGEDPNGKGGSVFKAPE